MMYTDLSKFLILIAFGFSALKLMPKSINNPSKMNIQANHPTPLEIFLVNPSNYSFQCTPGSKGEVLSAHLSSTNQLTIEYASFWEDGDHSGKVVGSYHSKKNRLDGRYQTNDGRFSGEINFTFNEKGEAEGSWDNGYGVIRMLLKQ